MEGYGQKEFLDMELRNFLGADALPILDQFLLDAHNILATGLERAVAQARATARADFRNYRADWMEADRAHKPPVPAPEPDDIGDFF